MLVRCVHLSDAPNGLVLLSPLGSHRRLVEQMSETDSPASNSFLHSISGSVEPINLEPKLLAVVPFCSWGPLAPLEFQTLVATSAAGPVRIHNILR